MGQIVIQFEVPSTTPEQLAQLCQNRGLKPHETKAVLTQLKDAEPGTKTVTIARP